MNRIFRFYINSSIHVAFAICSLVLITIIEFDLTIDLWLVFTIFFASVSGYNFVKYFGLAKFHHRSLASWLKTIQVFSFFAFIALIYCASFLSVTTLLYLGITSVITFFYAIPFLPQRFLINQDKSLRTIAGLKIYIIALVWALVVVVIPLKNAEMHLNNDALISFIQRFLYVVAVMLPFEIRDMKYDSLKLATIPQQIGVRNSKIIGIVIALLFFALQYFKDTLHIQQIAVYGIVAILIVISILGSNEKRTAVFSSFWVEAIPIIWLGLNYLIVFK